MYIYINQLIKFLINLLISLINITQIKNKKTMITCIHIFRVMVLLNKINNELRDENSSIYENSGPYARISSIDASIDSGFFTSSVRTTWNEINPRIINRELLEERIKEIDDLLENCDCLRDEVKDNFDLRKNLKNIREENEKNRSKNKKRKEELIKFYFSLK